jgi:hypothetical protein
VVEPGKLEAKHGAKLEKGADGWVRIAVSGGPPSPSEVVTLGGATDLAELTALRIEMRFEAGVASGSRLRKVGLTAGPRYGIGTSTAVGFVNVKRASSSGSETVSVSPDEWASAGIEVGPGDGAAGSIVVFEIDRDLRTDSGSTLSMELAFEGFAPSAIRFAVTDAERPVGIDGDGVPTAIDEIIAQPAEKRSAADQARFLAWYATIDAEHRALRTTMLDHAALDPRRTPMKGLICSEGLPPLRLHSQGADFFEKTFFLKRGDPNQKQGEATPSFLRVLMGETESTGRWCEEPPAGWRTSYRRRALANWITDVDQGAGALAARVIVNRLWQHTFGRGLVGTPSDFGKQGEAPTHPELLDWLAGELVSNGWRLKPVLKTIVLSRAYAQRSEVVAASAAIDPENRLVWRQNRRRLESEPLRDAILAVSGRLDDRLYGPGTLDERSRRRSIYLTVKRSKLVPMMVTFDGPDGLVPLPSRSSTTVAPQALLLMNSAWARDGVGGFASRVRPRDGGSFAESVNAAYRMALGRPATAAELSRGEAFLRAQIESRRGDGSTDAEGEALEDLCQVILCLNEFSYID